MITSKRILKSTTVLALAMTLAVPMPALAASKNVQEVEQIETDSTRHQKIGTFYIWSEYSDDEETYTYYISKTKKGASIKVTGLEGYNVNQILAYQGKTYILARKNDNAYTLFLLNADGTLSKKTSFKSEEGVYIIGIQKKFLMFYSPDMWASYDIKNGKLIAEGERAELYAASNQFVEPSKRLAVTISPVSKKAIKLSWKKQKGAKKVKAKKYKIYRARLNESHEVVGKYKLIATVSGKKKSYQDKKVSYGKNYIYIVTGTKGKKKVSGGNAAIDFYMGEIVGPESESEYITSPKSIYIPTMYPSGGMTPDGMVLERKIGNGSYSQVKTFKLKKNQLWITYLDKKVTKGKTYTYRCRSYKKAKKGKIYSKYFKITLTAAYNKGQFDVREVSNNKKTLVLALTSKAGNGILKLRPGKQTDSEGEVDTNCGLTGCSWNNKKWITKGTVSVKAGQTIYLRYNMSQLFTNLDEEDEEEFASSATDSWPTFYQQNIEYNGFSLNQTLIISPSGAETDNSGYWEY